ncbi:hypothetical protein JCM8547_007437 [Rhodosporidiobolus lusitaniae]
MAPSSSSTAPPPGFPPSVKYLTTPLPSRLLPFSSRATYCTSCPPHLLPNPPPRVSIKPISDPLHPANGQSGLFNTSGKKFERGTWIRDYVGVVHTEEEADGKSDYDLSLERRVVKGEKEGEEDRVEVTGIDATKAGNEARFVNDYRGVPTFVRPNALFELRHFTVSSPNPSKPPQECVRMSIWAGPHGVEKGSEICVSYGSGFWSERRKEWAEEEERQKKDGEKGMKEEAEKGKMEKQGKGGKGKKAKKG